jgi:pimeloyl-ACP methyl ester carboxylesterase
MPTTADIYYHPYQKNKTDSPPIVLIHGAGGNHLYWPSEIRRLPDHRVFALDLPGHGKSGGHGLQTIQANALSILDWMEALGFHQVVFIGHSMGGAIALTLALQHQEHVRGLVLISSGARLRVAPIILENTTSPQTLPSALSAITNLVFSKHADPRLVELAERRMAETRLSVLHGDFMSCNSFDVMENLAAIRTPTLVLCGQEDQLTPMRYSQYLADHIPGALLKIIPKAGHMVMLEQPLSVANALSDFLATISYYPGQSLRRGDQ